MVGYLHNKWDVRIHFTADAYTQCILMKIEWNENENEASTDSNE